MIYFLHGDIQKNFQKSLKMIDVLLKKKPDASLFRINEENFSKDKIDELIGGQGLFEKKYIVMMSRILESEENSEIILDKLASLAESENIFIWLEKTIKKDELKKIKKYAEKIEDAGIQTQKKNPEMNLFDLAGTFASRDKKKTWILFQKAKKIFPPEEIYGVMWWQIKSILIASKTNTHTEAGMKPFPYNKAKSYVKNFNERELKEMSLKWICVLHQSRLENKDLISQMEKFILE